jgi:uroporphyrinogen decarboxylase
MLNPSYNHSARQQLESLYGHLENEKMSPFQRVETAIQRNLPDRVPFDFWAVPEMVNDLKVYLNAGSDEDLLQLLGIDCRIVRPQYIGPQPERFADGTFYTEWGSHRRFVSNEFSTYEEYASFPLANATSVKEVEDWEKWPRTKYWDWKTIAPQVEQLNKKNRYHIRYEVGGIFESAWALYGLEKFLLDLVERPEIPYAIMNCYTELMIANVDSLMEEAKGLIDIVYTYDDIATQKSLIMSPAMWRKFIFPHHQRLNQVIKSHHLKILYHSCGAVYPLIPPLVDELGIDVLNPLQPRAAQMDMQKIKSEFGQKLAFHGGIDLQQTMSRGTCQEVQAEVASRVSVLGKNGGYICTTAHYIQADTPLENVIALYTAPRK